jgi:hypothetical protein
MGKHRRKHNKRNGQKTASPNTFNTENLNDIGSLLNNVDMNQLASMLNNIDLSQVSSMLSGLNSGGSGSRNEDGNENRNYSENSLVQGDKRVEILNAIKPLMDEEKGNFINSVIQLYMISKILKNK